MTERERRRLRWGAIASTILAIYLTYVIVFALTSGKHYANLGEKLTSERCLLSLRACRQSGSGEDSPPTAAPQRERHSSNRRATIQAL